MQMVSSGKFIDIKYCSSMSDVAMRNGNVLFKILFKNQFELTFILKFLKTQLKIKNIQISLELPE